MVVKRDSKRPTKKTKGTTLQNYLAIFAVPNRLLSDTVDELGYDKLIQMVDAGVDDFNSATQESCLSFIMVSRHMGIVSALETMQDPYFQPSPRLRKKYVLIHKNLRQDLNTVLSIYKKLKTSPRGLNWPILQAYEKDNPSARLLEQIRLMDSHLINPPRFSCPALGIKAETLKSKKHVITRRKKTENAY